MTSAFLAHPPLSSSAIFAVSVVVWTATNLSPYSSRHSRPHAIFRWTTSVEEYLRVQPSIFLLKHPAAQRVLDQLVKYSGCPSFNTSELRLSCSVHHIYRTPYNVSPPSPWSSGWPQARKSARFRVHDPLDGPPRDVCHMYEYTPIHTTST